MSCSYITVQLKQITSELSSVNIIRGLSDQTYPRVVAEWHMCGSYDIYAGHVDTVHINIKLLFVTYSGIQHYQA